MSLTAVKLTPEMVSGFLPRARRADIREIRQLSRIGIEEALMTSLAASSRCVALVNAEGTPMAIGGLRLEHSQAFVVPWLLCAEGIERHGKSLLRYCRGVLEKTPWPMHNRIDCENHDAIEFVRRLGAQFSFPDLEADGRTLTTRVYWGGRATLLSEGNMH